MVKVGDIVRVTIPMPRNSIGRVVHIHEAAESWFPVEVMMRNGEKLCFNPNEVEPALWPTRLLESILCRVRGYGTILK